MNRLEEKDWTTLMDECTDICEATGKSLKYGSPTTSEHSYQKNPFDFCFELARKQNINHRYAPNLATINQTSPLNTPSISLNEVVAPWIPLPLTTPMVTTSSIEVEPEHPFLQNLQKTVSFEDTLNGCSTKPNNNNNNNNVNQRSNVVSVICPPSAKASDSSGNSNLNDGSATARSAPVLNTDAARVRAEDLDIRLSVPKSAPSELTCLRSYPRKNKPPLLAPITLPFVPLPNQEEPSLATTAQPASLPSNDIPPPTTQKSNLESAKQSFSSLVNIVPKPAVKTGSVAKQLNISSLPPRRKEKTEEELLSRLKATEAALPPKAKPGRRSASAAKEDVNQKKRRSLERNRAAAMRCRLKKKKEIDELKIKVDEYEEQNHELKRIIEDLYSEVRQLKSELLRHKDCKESALR